MITLQCLSINKIVQSKRKMWDFNRFILKQGWESWKRKLEAEAVEAVKFLWKRKHLEERSWKRKQTRKRLNLYGAGRGSKKYSTASTSLF